MFICSNKKFALEKEKENEYIVYRVKGKKKVQRVQQIIGTQEKAIEVFDKWYKI